jgi:hypothetical protein
MLRRTIRLLLGIASIAGATGALPATADDAKQTVTTNRDRDRGRNPRARPPKRNRKAVPELDPAAVGALASVVAGGSVLLARRRKR